MASRWNKQEIVFFDVETSYPTSPREKRIILEFGAILICPRKLIELENYSTLVQPSDLSLISNLDALRYKGITPEDLLRAPTFAQIADKVYHILHGRIWAGHNVERFDSVRITEAFAEINRQPPEPRGKIDTLALLPQRFGRRAGNMKMASLANYFEIGQQTHRSLDDVRMNLEVLKRCADVLFLEWSLIDILNEDHPILEPRNVGRLTSEMERGPLQLEDRMEEEEFGSASRELFVTFAIEGGSSHVHFLEPKEISTFSICPVLAPHPFYPGAKKIQIFHENRPLQICCKELEVRFGINAKFHDKAGRPRLSFVVDASPSLCTILDAIDKLALQLSVNSGSSSEWRSSVKRNTGSFNSSTVRLNMPITSDHEILHCGTEIWCKESSTTQRLVFSKPVLIDDLLTPGPGDSLDAYFSLDAYDFKQKAGIKLVAKKLIIHPRSDRQKMESRFLFHLDK